jgi:hypothetical protein
MRLSFDWLPLHPIGLAVVSSFTIGAAVWFSSLVAWIAKNAVTRWGGMSGYRRVAPFFLGVCVGHFIGRAMALIAGTVFGVKLL